jgi:hypothetical protein
MEKGKEKEKHKKNEWKGSKNYESGKEKRRKAVLLPRTTFSSF